MRGRRHRNALPRRLGMQASEGEKKRWRPKTTSTLRNSRRVSWPSRRQLSQATANGRKARFGESNGKVIASSMVKQNNSAQRRLAKWPSTAGGCELTRDENSKTKR